MRSRLRTREVGLLDQLHRAGDVGDQMETTVEAQNTVVKLLHAHADSVDAEGAEQVELLGRHRARCALEGDLARRSESDRGLE